MPSETDISAHERRDLPESAVRAQLERVLASEVFSRSKQLRRFLTFIVQQRLAGQGDSLKESVLAHELYGKGTDFDCGTDPVVRVDARRLRDKLREYRRGPIRSRRHLAAEGQLRARLRSECCLTHPHGSSARSSVAATDIVGSEPQANEDRRRRSGGRRSSDRRRACLARTPHSGGRSSPAVPTGLIPWCGGGACVVPGRQPRRLRVVGPRRGWSTGHLRQGRRE